MVGFISEGSDHRSIGVKDGYNPENVIYTGVINYFIGKIHPIDEDS